MAFWEGGEERSFFWAQPRAKLSERRKTCHSALGADPARSNLLGALVPDVHAAAWWVGSLSLSPGSVPSPWAVSYLMSLQPFVHSRCGYPAGGPSGGVAHVKGAMWFVSRTGVEATWGAGRNFQAWCFGLWEAPSLPFPFLVRSLSHPLMGTRLSWSHTRAKVAATGRAHPVIDNWALVDEGEWRPSGHNTSVGSSMGEKEGKWPGVLIIARCLTQEPLTALTHTCPYFASLMGWFVIF